MNVPLRIVTPLLIIAALGLVSFLIIKNPPQAQRRAPASGAQMVVETISVTRRDYPVRLQSYGTVAPRTRSVLVAQVGGLITAVDASLRAGGFFEKGDVLAVIDPRDYEADVRIAEATVMDARQALAEAQARTEQARIDWQRLGNDGEPSDLVLRLPQLQAARARVSSAQSNLEKKNLDLERTQIVAPYAGRVLRKLVDVGQVVSANSQLAEIYASDYLEVRLPLKNRDLRFVNLPEAYRDGDVPRDTSVGVQIRSDLGGDASWQARMVRTESAIDETARQLHVIAQIDDPFASEHATRAPLKIGQYVTAQIEGVTLFDAIVIPNAAIYQGSYAYVVEDGLLQRKNLEVVWQNDQEAVIGAGLAGGDALVVTPLGQVTSGIRVAIEGEARAPRGASRGMSSTP